MGSFTSLQRKYIYVLLAVIFVTRLALAFRSDANHGSRLFEDDSYYMMSCARHLALGDGLSADGIHPTNGVQPLFVFACVPAFFIAQADRWLGVRLTFLPLTLFSMISLVLAALVMKEILRTPKTDSPPPLRDPVIWIAAIYALSYPLMAEMMNGLETGLYTMLLLATLLWYFRMINAKDFSLRKEVMLGLLFGLLVLSRIDALFFLAAFGLDQLVRYGRSSVARVIVVGLIALAVSAPWWIYNVVSFGNLLPTSGQAETLGSAPLGLNLRFFFLAFADLLTGFFSWPARDPSIPVLLLWVIASSFLVSLLLLYYMRLEKKSRLNLRMLMPFVLAALAMLPVYVLRFHSYQFIHRYLQPFRILWLFVLGCALASVAQTRTKSQRILNGCK